MVFSGLYFGQVGQGYIQRRCKGNQLEEGMAITPVFLPGKFHGQQSLVGYSPWSHKELETPESVTLSFLY